MYKYCAKISNFLLSRRRIEDDGDAPSDIRPTRNEALQAAPVVKKYVQELNDPFTRKLEPEAIIDTFLVGRHP